MSKAKDLAGLVSSGGILADGTVNLASEVTGTLPIASGGTGTTSTTFANLTTNVTGTLPIANGGTGTTSTTFANLTTNVTGTLPIANGGTNATTADGALTALGGTTVGTNVFKAVDAAAARSAISAASTGANSDITSITGLTTALSPSQGGTGLTAVGALGNVLTSNGTAWVSSAPAGGVTYIAKTANYTAIIGDCILADTSSGSFTITLPASPSTGGVISIIDSKGTFTQSPLAIDPNGNTINKDSTIMYVSNTGFAFDLIYNGSDWRIA